MTVLLSGLWSSEIGRRVAALLGAAHSTLDVRRFPDGELYVRVPVDVAGQDVVLLISAGRRPNDAIVEALLAVETARRMGASRVVLAMPYFPYARQDAEFKKGEALSLAIVSRTLKNSGIDALVTVDLHLHRVKDVREVFPIPVFNVTVMEDLAEYLRSRCRPRECSIIAPDEEAEQWAKLVAASLKVDYAVLKKERRGDEEVRVSGSIPSSAETAVIVDDIISTGSTVAEAALLLRSSGSRRIIAACAHAILAEGAEARIFQAGVDEIVASDTVPNPYAKVSAHRALARGIRDALSIR